MGFLFFILHEPYIGRSVLAPHPSPLTMILHLVRHGESTHNAEGRIQGHAEISLSEKGRLQAEAAADALADLPIDALYASPLRRARETAEIFSARLSLPIQFDDRLKEINVGIFQSQKRTDLEKTHPVEIARWRSEDLDYAVPGGESRRQLLERGRAAIEEIAQNKFDRVVVVAHGRIFTVVLKDILGIPQTEPPFSVQNGSITTLEYKNGRFSLLAMDDVDHLTAVGTSGRGDL